MDRERFERGTALRDADQEREALRELEALASSEPDAQWRSSLLANQASCLWRLGRLPEARQRWTEAVALWTNIYLEFLDACLCAAEGDKEEAIRKLTLLLKGHPELEESDARLHIDALEQLGRALIDLVRYSEAINPLETALTSAEGEQRKTLCFYLGQCYFQHHRWQEAAEMLAQSLPSEPTGPWWAPAQRLLGICHIETGNFDVAEKELVQSLPADGQSPEWAELQFHLGRLYFHRREYISAKKAFELCEFFVDDPAQQENISRWLAATCGKLNERLEPNA
jgi:tetratricopeptide (TPR) repeat protein